MASKIKINYLKSLHPIQYVIWFLVTILLVLTGCSSLRPAYSSHVNTYSSPQIQTIDSNFISGQLIHTYTTAQLEKAYTNHFCANLADCSDNINNVKDMPELGYFDLSKHPIINNKQHVTTIDLYRILYTTPGQDSKTQTVSGAVFIPNMPKDKIKGVILFFHPTFFSKTNVPSYTPNKATDETIAAIFVTQGYIVVAPDYIGMGYNKDVFHPYILYPQVNATDGLSILEASNKFLKDHGYLITNESIPLFVTGYSEGGSYALWFSRLVQEQTDFKQRLNNNTSFNLKLVAPISGPYSLSGVTYNYLFSDVGSFTKSNFNVQSSIMAARLKPALLAYTLTSYAYYSESSQFNLVFNPDFFNMECTLQYSYECKFNDQQLNLYQALSTESDDYTIVMKISNAASHKTNQGRIFMDQWNSIQPLINPNLLDNHNFKLLLTNGDIDYWHSTIPTTLIYLQHDSVVSSYNSILTLHGMQENNSENLHSIAIDNDLIQDNVITILPNFNVDHITGFYYLYLAAVNQFNQNCSSPMIIP